MIKFDLEVDATSLHCPLPLLRLKQALVAVEPAQIIKIIATDPAAHLDIGVYTEQTGHVIMQIIQENSCQIFYIQKNPS